MSLLVLFEVQAKPECLDQLKTFFREILPGTRGYPGCRGLTTYADQDNPNTLLLVELWDSRDSYAEYRAWRIESGTVGRLESMLVSPPTIRYLDETDI